MHHRSATFQRLVSTLVLLPLVCGAILTGPAATAEARQQSATLFAATFDGLPNGPVTAPLAVTTGSVTPAEGRVAITPVAGSPALTVDGTGGPATALLQFSNYPGELPTKEQGAVQLRIEANFTVPLSPTGTLPITTTPGASFGLFASPAFYEFFSFGPNGQLTRAGLPLGLQVVPGELITFEARVKVGPGRQVVQLSLQTGTGKRNFNLTLDDAFTRANINQVRFQTLAASGITAIDNIRIRLLPDEPERELPAQIVIGDKEIEQEVVLVNGIVFVNVTITIINTGGTAQGTFLVLNLDDFDQLFALDDLSFLEGIGYVAKVEGKLMYIGLGKNNTLDGKLKLKLKFKAKKNEGGVKANIKFNLTFDDVDGFRSLPVAVVIAVPVTVVQPVVLPVIMALPIERIDVRFKQAWETRGGVLLFGLPLTEPITLTNGVIVQYFERARLELHPDLVGTPYYIQLGLLAVELGYAQVPTTTTVPTNTADLVWYFQPTGYLIATPFRSFWKSKGGLAIFGLPITGVIFEGGRQVQYFERARLELHPEASGTPYVVQIGLLGIERLKRT